MFRSLQLFENCCSLFIRFKVQDQIRFKRVSWRECYFLKNHIVIKDTLWSYCINCRNRFLAILLRQQFIHALCLSLVCQKTCFFILYRISDSILFIVTSTENIKLLIKYKYASVFFFSFLCDYFLYQSRTFIMKFQEMRF